MNITRAKGTRLRILIMAKVPSLAAVAGGGELLSMAWYGSRQRREGTLALRTQLQGPPLLSHQHVPPLALYD